MSLKWRLCVKNFGKIEYAEIEPSPFMVFIGDNNSGKSYLMSLLWGIVNYAEELLNLEKQEIYKNTFNTCNRWYKTQVDNEDIVLDKNSQEVFVKWMNEILAKNKNKLIQMIFNKDIKIDELNIIWEYTEDVILNKTDLFYNIDTDRINVFLRILYYLIFEPYKRYFCKDIHQPMFLPASRTGFTLTYKILLDNLINEGFSMINKMSSAKSTFMMPVISFLRNWLKLSTEKNKKYESIITFLEQEILKGSIHKDNTPIGNVLYTPKESKEHLPMYASSSLVTEITPLVLFLTYLDGYSTLIMEEAEAHLHLKAQIAMTRALSRLVNSGLNVWITTHSDIMIQQINNMIKLYNHSDKENLMKKYNYEEIDLLEQDKVTFYQFDIVDDKTFVQKLPNSIYGIAVPTFNETLHDLMNQTMDFQEE